MIVCFRGRALACAVTVRGVRRSRCSRSTWRCSLWLFANSPTRTRPLFAPEHDCSLPVFANSWVRGAGVREHQRKARPSFAINEALFAPGVREHGCRCSRTVGLGHGRCSRPNTTVRYRCSRTSALSAVRRLVGSSGRTPCTRSGAAWATAGRDSGAGGHCAGQPVGLELVVDVLGARTRLAASGYSLRRR